MKKDGIETSVWDMFKCPFCDKKFKKIPSLKNHVRSHHLNHDIYCPYCNLEFESVEKLRYHLVTKNDIQHEKLYSLITRKTIDKELKDFLFSKGD